MITWRNIFCRNFFNSQKRFWDSILIMVEQFFLVIHKPLHKYYLLLVKYYYPYIVTQSPYLEKTAIKLTYIRQQSSADPIFSIITSSVFVSYKSYRFCESPAFSMFHELNIKIKLLRQYGKKTWEILHLLSEKGNLLFSYYLILYRVVRTKFCASVQTFIITAFFKLNLKRFRDFELPNSSAWVHTIGVRDPGCCREKRQNIWWENECLNERLMKKRIYKTIFNILFNMELY